MKLDKWALAIVAALAVSGAGMVEARGGGGGHGGGGGWHGGGGGGGHGGGGGGWHGGGGSWHGGGHGWHGSSVGFYFGGGYWGWPYAWPYYGWPYYYGYPYASSYYYYDDFPYAYRFQPYVPSESPAYTEPELQGRAPAPQTYWYYCTDPAGYYPYVGTCSKPWVRVKPDEVLPPPDAPQPPKSSN